MAYITIDRSAAADGILAIRFDRPQARNAMTMAMVRDLMTALDVVAADPACRVVLLAGEGAAFCAGLDLKAAMADDDAPDGALAWRTLQELYAGTILRLRRLPQPIVAAVQGAAIGFGFGLALAADIRLAATGAAFSVGAVKLGLSAGECGISYHLPRLVGAGRAFEIMLTGRPVAAAEAEAIGLVSRIVDDAHLLDETLATARLIAANSPYAIMATKSLMWANLEAASLDAAVALENHVQVTGLVTDDFREAARAFAEKRPPLFTGR
jgi:enoyl-CoA hydratase